VILEFGFLVRDGGLMSYGPDFDETFARAADLVDRIFKGAKPVEPSRSTNTLTAHGVSGSSRVAGGF
jgi:ABC-type uncharacterized transport system substrate-binding protein